METKHILLPTACKKFLPLTSTENLKWSISRNMTHSLKLWDRSGRSETSCIKGRSEASPCYTVCLHFQVSRTRQTVGTLEFLPRLTSKIPKKCRSIFYLNDLIISCHTPQLRYQLMQLKEQLERDSAISNPQSLQRGHFNSFSLFREVSSGLLQRHQRQVVTHSTMQNAFS